MTGNPGGEGRGEKRMETVHTIPRSAQLRPLSKTEIDRRIQGLLAELAPREAEGGSLAPRPISPAELVRRVAPFISRN